MLLFLFKLFIVSVANVHLITCALNVFKRSSNLTCKYLSHVTSKLILKRKHTYQKISQFEAWWERKIIKRKKLDVLMIFRLTMDARADGW